jgi:CubicO group peptidase (beta-lactamase class C family)
MSEATVHRILDEQAAGKDKVMGVPMRYGMGFGLIDPATFPLSPNERSFFWGGWGGSIAVTDLDARMSVAYVMNRMDADLLGDVRGGSIVLSAYKALAA